jgi:hypothetical protein
VLERSHARRLRLTRLDRLLWVWFSRVWCDWRTALVVVTSETVIAWHRRGFRLFWTWKSRHRTGRPTVPHEVRTLIRTMSAANPLWGAPRIHGELLKPGLTVSQTTVATYMVRRRPLPSQTWRAFLTNHAQQLIGDFFVVPTATCRLLFVLVLLAHDPIADRPLDPRHHGFAITQRLFVLERVIELPGLCRDVTAFEGAASAQLAAVTDAGLHVWKQAALHQLVPTIWWLGYDAREVVPVRGGFATIGDAGVTVFRAEEDGRVRVVASRSVATRSVTSPLRPS